MPYFLHALWKTDLKELSEADLWEHYEKCLKAHDWTYQYSDDHGVWRAGTEESDHLSAIRKLTEADDKDRSDKLYWRHCFWLNEDGSRKEI